MLKCPITGCKWKFESMYGTEMNFKVMSMHASAEHPTQESSAPGTSKLPQLDSPKVDAGIDEEAWRIFTVWWKQYCEGSQLTPKMQSLKLFQCLDKTTGDLLALADPIITDRPPDEVMRAMYKMVVIPSAKGAARAELMTMLQGNDEPIHIRCQGSRQGPNMWLCP